MNDFTPEDFNEDPFDQADTQTDISPVGHHQQNLPAAVNSEKALLGRLLLNGQDLFASVQSQLKVDHFFSLPHREIYKALIKLNDQNTAFDPITVCDLLDRRKRLNRAGGQQYVMDLVNHGMLNANVENLATIIYERAALREIIQASKNVIADSFSDEAYDSQFVLEQADQRLRAIADKRPQQGGLQDMSDILDKTFERLTEIRQNGSNITGITTGFAHLNKITSGWQRSDLIILAARPSMGKTALALSFLEHAARDKKKVLLFSLEMPAVSITMRLIAAMSKVPLSSIREAKLTPQEWKEVGSAVAELKSYNVAIDDSSGLTISQMRDRIRHYARQNGNPDLVLVDYLGLMQSAKHKDNRVHEVSEISGGLKQMARDFECPVIALSQLSRNVEQRNNKKPVLADLRDSGSIEQDADLILFIYREEYYTKENTKPEKKGVADIIIAKHRNGEIGEVGLHFNAPVAQFSNLIYAEADSNIDFDN